MYMSILGEKAWERKQLGERVAGIVDDATKC
jgi:hypothetical protein